MERSIPFHTLPKLVDAEEINSEKYRNLHLPMKINEVTSKLESQKSFCETYDPNPENNFKQTTDPNNKSKPQFWNYCIFCHKSNPSD